MPDFGDVNPDTGQTSARTQFEGTVDPLAPSVANGQITPEQWAEYQRKRRMQAILGMVGTVGGAMGAGALGSLFGGGGSAAGSAAGGALPPLSGGAPWAVTPLATTVSPVGAGLGAGMGAGAGAGVGAAAGSAAGGFMGLSPQQLAAIAMGGASMVGGAMNRPASTAPTSATTDPNMQRLLQTMQGRLDQSEPLYKSIMAMANGLLPTQYQNGGAGR